MPTSPTTTPTPTPRQAAETAMRELDTALRRHGILLPSLSVDGHALRVGLRPLLGLGRVNLDTAKMLTDALNSPGASTP
ncbi:hypothetical protein [Streptomyces sp. SBT349]|uniref:hypothetical protein n=1 Tax=Streptomyces sp. SBT349 TaxID=1580539 RepID=UPI00066C6D8A|nr:hypothetical protein [Streptomyces sp. SBT349]